MHDDTDACTRFKAEIRDDQAARLKAADEGRQRVEEALRELEEAQDAAGTPAPPASAR